MLSTRHLILCGCAAVLAFAGAPGPIAWGQEGRGESGPLDLLERPAKGFERSVEVHVRRVEERQARREARRERRQARREARRSQAVEEVGVARSTLDAIAACESGGDPAAVNPAGYYGKYQFDVGTWRSVGGTGNPAEAPEPEQDYRAALLYSRAGAGPWPVCGA